MAANDRIAWVNYAKAIGITLVVYAHMARGIVAAGIEMPRRFFELTDSIIYSFHMPLFFFLAGIFFFKSYDSRRNGLNFAFSKVDTIVYPYLIWSFLQGTVEALFSRYTNGTVSFADVFSLLWAPRAQFWFIYALFLIFILSAIVFTWVPKRGAWVVFGTSVALYLAQPSLSSGFVVDYIATDFVFFMLGVIFEVYANRRMFFSMKALAALLVTAVVGQFLFHVTFGLTYLDHGLGNLAVSIVSVLLVVNISYFLSLRPNRVLLLIGSSSMAIFLMHIMAGSGTRVVLQEIMPGDSYILHLVLGTAMGLLAPLLALFVIERLRIRYAFSAPVGRWLKDATLSRA
jgi:fucose 4-O-acetylase-like acetyltransferase